MTTAFLAGNPDAWDPFAITVQEKFFFIYHLCELDQMMSEIITALGELSLGTILESKKASEITCRAFFSMLERVKTDLAPRCLPEYRTARELALTIAKELDLTDLLPQGGFSSSAPRLPRPRYLPSKGTATLRRTTKSADHQTIPRFEQLVDLGFLVKPKDSDYKESYKSLSPRRWRYQPTEICRIWNSVVGKVVNDSQWLRKSFCSIAVLMNPLCPTPVLADRKTAAHFIARAYRMIHRPVGHTPFYSVALLALLLAATEGHILEVIHLHRFLLGIKKHNLIPDVVFFSGGNEIENMFILFREDFEENFENIHDEAMEASA
jgi:hypothetical protein